MSTKRVRRISERKHLKNAWIFNECKRDHWTQIKIESISRHLTSGQLNSKRSLQLFYTKTNNDTFAPINNSSRLRKKSFVEVNKAMAKKYYETILFSVLKPHIAPCSPEQLANKNIVIMFFASCFTSNAQSLKQTSFWWLIGHFQLTLAVSWFCQKKLNGRKRDKIRRSVFTFANSPSGCPSSHFKTRKGIKNTYHLSKND